MLFKSLVVGAISAAIVHFTGLTGLAFVLAFLLSFYFSNLVIKATGEEAE